MNELVTCIEYLLLHHNSVSIVGLGEFEAQEVESQYILEEGMLFPPRRVVTFKNEWKEDNADFLKSLSKILGITLAKAEQLLIEWIAEFHQQLEDNGYVDFGSIGTFQRQEEFDNSIMFLPSESGIASPEYYGLDAFIVSRIDVAQPNNKEVPGMLSVRKDNKNITISISKNVVNYVSTIAAAIIMFVFFSVPAENTLTTQDVQQCQMFFPENLITVQNKTAEHLEVASKITNANTTTVSEATTANGTSLSTTQAPALGTSSEKEEETNTYSIVVASNVMKGNALAYAEKLTKAGHKEARVTEGNIIRVVVGKYNTELEAQDVARTLRNQSEEFKHVWVIKL